MICPNCQNEISNNAKFCNKCGIKLNLPDLVKEKNNFKNILINLFNIQRKKNFIEAIILYGISVSLILPLYFVFPTNKDTETYILNAIICFLLIFLVSYFKKNKFLYIWPIISAFIGYLFGSLYGLLVLIPVFMQNSRKKIVVINKMEKDYIFNLYKNGVIYYTLGIIVTITSYAVSEEKYTIWYGAVIWGFYLIAKGIYYQSKPELVLKKINEYYEKNKEYPREKKFFEISPTFKKFIVYFVILILIFTIVGIFANI